jgi:hypothetical protein
MGRIEEMTAYFGRFTSKDLPKWVSDLQKDGPVRFLVRMLGAAAFRSCALALKADGAVLAVAIRRATRALLPYAAALDDIYAYAPAKSAARLPILAGTPSAVVLLAIQLDELFGEKSRNWGLPLATAATQSADQSDLSAEDLPALVETLREFSVNKSRAAAAELSATIDRKIRGARYAIEHSPDPVGQAASSLIELLDRMLRSAFSDDYVLSWIDRNYKPQRKDLTYIPKDSKAGRERPT